MRDGMLASGMIQCAAAEEVHFPASSSEKPIQNLSNLI